MASTSALDANNGDVASASQGESSVKDRRNIVSKIPRKMVWVTQGKMEHPAFLLQDVEGRDMVLIEWESTKAKEEVPVTSIHFNFPSRRKRQARKEVNVTSFGDGLLSKPKQPAKEKKKSTTKKSTSTQGNSNSSEKSKKRGRGKRKKETSENSNNKEDGDGAMGGDHIRSGATEGKKARSSASAKVLDQPTDLEQAGVNDINAKQEIPAEMPYNADAAVGNESNELNAPSKKTDKPNSVEALGNSTKKADDSTGPRPESPLERNNLKTDDSEIKKTEGTRKVRRIPPKAYRGLGKRLDFRPVWRAFSAMPPGKYSVRISKDGMDSLREDVNEDILALFEDEKDGMNYSI